MWVTIKGKNINLEILSKKFPRHKFCQNVKTKQNESEVNSLTALEGGKCWHLVEQLSQKRILLFNGKKISLFVLPFAGGTIRLKETEDNEGVIHCGQRGPPSPTHWMDIGECSWNARDGIGFWSKVQEILPAKSHQPPSLTHCVTDNNLDFFYVW